MSGLVRIVLILVLVLALWLAVWLRPTRPSGPEAATPAATEGPPAVRHSTPLRKAPREKISPAAGPTSAGGGSQVRRQLSQELADRGWVEFKTENGAAVAFGDVMLGVSEEGAARGNAVAPALRFWPSPRIPYAIDPSVAHPDRIEAAIAYLREHTPIQFEPFDGEDDAIVFVEGEKHCYSYLGRIGGHQPIHLSDGCGVSEILHEIMHALGFIHEQSRTDRDAYVEVHWEHIEEEAFDQFNQAPPSLMTAVQGSRFSYDSIMLYSPTHFAREPGKPTLTSLTEEPISPVASGLSAQDIERLYLLYGEE